MRCAVVSGGGFRGIPIEGGAGIPRRRRIHQHGGRIDGALVVDVRFFDDVGELDGTQGDAELRAFALNFEHASHHPPGRKQNLAGLDARRALRCAIDGPGESIGGRRADRFCTMFHDDDIGLICHARIQFRRDAIAGFGVAQSRRGAPAGMLAGVSAAAAAAGGAARLQPPSSAAAVRARPRSSSTFGWSKRMI